MSLRTRANLSFPYHRRLPAFALLAGLLLAGLAPAAEPTAIASPNGRIHFTLSPDAQGALAYTVTLAGRAVIERSPLAITVDGVELAAGIELGNVERYRVDEKYPWYGVHSTAANRCNGARFRIVQVASRTAYTLEARAYDDGVAFRFIVPGADGKLRVPDEATLFRVPAGSTVWYHNFEGHYERVHDRKSIEDVPAGDWAAPPLTIKLPGGLGYASITEGDLRNYSGMGLQADGQRGFHTRLGHAHPVSYPFRLRYKDEVERVAQPAAVPGTITTPWRIVIIGADLNTLVNSDLVTNVSPPPDPKYFPKGLRTEWVRPGRAVWRYLDGGENTFEGMKEFSRLAAELGFEYNLLEGFWQKWPEEQLRELVDYSRGLGVGIVLWKHSRDLREPDKIRDFFQLCRRVGVAGVKLDFYDHEARAVVDLYEAHLRAAAEQRLVVNFHGANKPTGLSRTWPNELTREAIRGMESRQSPRARHDATLPFTRMLAGHADYTPVHLGERRNDTTWAHQIATAAIFTSPLLVYGAHPRSLLENPAVEVIKAIPSVWDETIALPISEIGEVAVFARRSGRVWFLAILNGPEPRTVDIPLSFLGRGKYQAVLIRDSAEKRDAVAVQKTGQTSRDSIRIELQAGGGFIAKFAP